MLHSLSEVKSKVESLERLCDEAPLEAAQGIETSARRTDCDEAPMEVAVLARKTMDSGVTSQLSCRAHPDATIVKDMEWGGLQVCSVCSGTAEDVDKVKRVEKEYQAKLREENRVYMAKYGVTNGVEVDNSTVREEERDEELLGITVGKKEDFSYEALLGITVGDRKALNFDNGLSSGEGRGRKTPKKRKTKPWGNPRYRGGVGRVVEPRMDSMKQSPIDMDHEEVDKLQRESGTPGSSWQGAEVRSVRVVEKTANRVLRTEAEPIRVKDKDRCNGVEQTSNEGVHSKGVAAVIREDKKWLPKGATMGCDVVWDGMWCNYTTAEDQGGMDVTLADQIAILDFHMKDCHSLVEQPTAQPPLLVQPHRHPEVNGAEPALVELASKEKSTGEVEQPDSKVMHSKAVPAGVGPAKVVECDEPSNKNSRVCSDCGFQINLTHKNKAKRKMAEHRAACTENKMVDQPTREVESCVEIPKVEGDSTKFVDQPTREVESCVEIPQMEGDSTAKLEPGGEPTERADPEFAEDTTEEKETPAAHPKKESPIHSLDDDGLQEATQLITHMRLEEWATMVMGGGSYDKAPLDSQEVVIPEWGSGESKDPDIVEEGDPPDWEDKRHAPEVGAGAAEEAEGGGEGAEDTSKEDTPIIPDRGCPIKKDQVLGEGAAAQDPVDLTAKDSSHEAAHHVQPDQARGAEAAAVDHDKLLGAEPKQPQAEKSQEGGVEGAENTSKEENEDPPVREDLSDDGDEPPDQDGQRHGPKVGTGAEEEVEGGGEGAKETSNEENKEAGDTDLLTQQDPDLGAAELQRQGTAVGAGAEEEAEGGGEAAENTSNEETELSEEGEEPPDQDGQRHGPEIGTGAKEEAEGGGEGAKEVFNDEEEASEHGEVGDDPRDQDGQRHVPKVGAGADEEVEGGGEGAHETSKVELELPEDDEDGDDPRNRNDPRHVPKVGAGAEEDSTKGEVDTDPQALGAKADIQVQDTEAGPCQHQPVERDLIIEDNPDEPGAEQEEEKGPGQTNTVPEEDSGGAEARGKDEDEEQVALIAAVLTAVVAVVAILTAVVAVLTAVVAVLTAVVAAALTAVVAAVLTAAERVTPTAEVAAKTQSKVADMSQATGGGAKAEAPEARTALLDEPPGEKTHDDPNQAGGGGDEALLGGEHDQGVREHVAHHQAGEAQDEAPTAGEHEGEEHPGEPVASLINEPPGAEATTTEIVPPSRTPASSKMAAKATHAAAAPESSSRTVMESRSWSHGQGVGAAQDEEPVVGQHDAAHEHVEAHDDAPAAGERGVDETPADQLAALIDGPPVAEVDTVDDQAAEAAQDEARPREKREGLPSKKTTKIRKLPQHTANKDLLTGPGRMLIDVVVF